MTFYNLAREYTTTTGTGTVTLTGAVPGCNTWDNAGVPNGAVVSYSIITYSTTSHRPTGSECGSGTYTTSGKTLTRTTVESSTNGGSKITLTGLSEVFITPLASDFAAGGNTYATYIQNGSADTITDTTNNSGLTIDTEWADSGGVASLASNTITLAGAGDYQLGAQIYVTASDFTTAFNGYIYGTIHVNRPAPAATYNFQAQIGYVTAMGLTDDYIFVPPTFFQALAGDEITVLVSNHSGTTIDAYMFELMVRKMS